MTHTQHQLKQGFFRARLSRDGYLGLHLTLGVATLLMAALVFAHIAHDVFTGRAIVTLDLHVAAWFHAHTQPTLTPLVLLFTNLHNTVGVLALTLLFAAFLAKKGGMGLGFAPGVGGAFGHAAQCIAQTYFSTRPAFI